MSIVQEAGPPFADRAAIFGTSCAQQPAVSFGSFITRPDWDRGFVNKQALPAGAATTASRNLRTHMSTRPNEEVIGAGHRAVALVLSLKASLLERGFDPTKIVAEEQALLKALPESEREQSAKEAAWHTAVEQTTDLKRQVATKASCLCDLVITAFTRNNSEGQDAMNVRAGLYSGAERRSAPSNITVVAPIAAAA